MTKQNLIDVENAASEILTLFKNISAEPQLVAGLTCNSCEHRQRHQCNSKVFQYCGVRKSNTTDNGSWLCEERRFND